MIFENQNVGIEILGFQRQGTGAILPMQHGPKVSKDLRSLA
jgi:hypothetical protein